MYFLRYTSCTIISVFYSQLSKSYHLCLILVFDVLYGKGLRCGGVLKSAISRHINKLRHAKESIGSLMDTSLHTGSTDDELT